jgi:hypothetical protein
LSFITFQQELQGINFKPNYKRVRHPALGAEPQYGVDIVDCD